ncbi:dihydrodipicolinate synthase family protein [Chitinophaga qingshengii]|nr:dihydrodipicolinate synthase family protein [Chitinophaga qingshengii]
MNDMTATRIQGLVAAPFTPMHEDGSVHTERIHEMVQVLIANGIQGIFVCGSTGEGPSMTTAERMETAAAFIRAAGKKLKVFVHVGHNSLQDARHLAAHAQEHGADYISATLPTYFKIQTIDGLIQSLATIAEGAPGLPLFYYNIPALTGISLDMVAFLEQAATKLPTLAGIKYTAPLIHDFQACMHASEGRYELLYGTDEMLLSALATGAHGFIGSTYNFAAPLYNQLIQSFTAGNLHQAQQCQLQSVEMVRIIVKYGGLRAQKAMMRMIGLDCGNVRLPLQPFEKNEYISMEKDLRAIGFFDWCTQVSRP